MEIAGLCLPLKPQKERGYYRIQDIHHQQMEYSIGSFQSINQKGSTIRRALSGYGLKEKK